MTAWTCLHAMQWLCCPDSYTSFTEFIHVQLQPPPSPNPSEEWIHLYFPLCGWSNHMQPLQSVRVAKTGQQLQCVDLCSLNFFLFESVLSLKPVRLHPSTSTTTFVVFLFLPVSLFFFPAFMCSLLKRSLMSSGGTWSMWYISLYDLRGFWRRFWSLGIHCTMVFIPTVPPVMKLSRLQADFDNNLIRFHGGSQTTLQVNMALCLSLCIE